MKNEGYTRFAMHHHTSLWKDLDARKSGKGYGVDVCGTWYWYESWVSQVSDHCAANRAFYKVGKAETALR